MRRLTNFYDFRLKGIATEGIRIHPTKAWLSQLGNFKNASGREDTLEERYTIKFCFKLGKMPQHLAGIDHQFLSGIRDSRKAGSLWEMMRGVGGVRKSEHQLIGQIKNFMDKDRRVSIETISAQFNVSVRTVHTIIHEELKMRKICAKVVPKVLREDQEERRCHDNREMVELINSDPAVFDSLVTCNESWIYFYDPETKRQSSQWKHAGYPRPKKARQRKSTHKLLMIPFLTALAWSTCTGFPLDWESIRNTMLSS